MTVNMARRKDHLSIQDIIHLIGIIIALACIVWVAGHLVAFSIFGSITVGESNIVLLLAELGLVSFGLFCFLYTHLQSWFKKEKRGS